MIATRTRRIVRHTTDGSDGVLVGNPASGITHGIQISGIVAILGGLRMLVLGLSEIGPGTTGDTEDQLQQELGLVCLSFVEHGPKLSQMWYKLSRVHGGRMLHRYPLSCRICVAILTLCRYHLHRCIGIQGLYRRLH